MRYGRGLSTFGVTVAVLLDGPRRLSRPAGRSYGLRTKENSVVGLGPAAVELVDLSDIVRHMSPTLLLVRISPLAARVLRGASNKTSRKVLGDSLA